MKLRKLPYYLLSVYILLKSTNLILSLILSIKHKKYIIVCNNMKFIFLTALDLLIIKETILDDSYKLKTNKHAEHIIDIGGALGDFSIYAAKLFPASKITLKL